MKLGKRVLSFLLVLCIVASFLPTSCAIDNSYKDWMQTDSRWGNLVMGRNASVAAYGCAVTSVAKLLVQYGSCSAESFNVATLVTWLNQNGGFTSSGCIVWKKPAEMVGIGYDTTCLWTGGTAESLKQRMLELLNQHCGIVLAVNDFGHYVAVDGEKTLQTGEIYIMDTTSDKPRTDILLSSRYSEVNGYMIYKFNQGPILCPHDSNPKAYTDNVGKCTACKQKIALKDWDESETVKGIYKVVKKDCVINEEPYEASTDKYKPRKGEKVTVVAKLLNARGNYWYKLEGGGYNGGYIWADNLEKIGPIPSEIKVCDIRMTSNAIPIAPFDIAVHYDSARKITNVAAWVENATGSIINSVGRPSYTPPESESKCLSKASGSTIDYGLKLQNLPGPGVYTLVLQVTDDTGNQKRGTFTFTAIEPAKPNCAVPTVSQADINGGKMVTLSCGTSGAAMYYTTDGSTPTTGSTRYTEPFPVYMTAQIKILAVCSGHNDSTAQQTVQVTMAGTPSVETTNTPQGVRVAMTAQNGAAIYYTIDGGSEILYTAPFYMTEAAHLEAYAAKNGLQNSMPSMHTITPQAPGTPRVQLANTEDQLPVGRTATVKWAEDSRAANYTVTLYHEGMPVDTVTQTENMFSFTLDEVGDYEVTVYAENAVGCSEESEPVEVESMAPVTVTFIDAAEDGEDGEVLAEITVEYGAFPEEIPAPSRRGYDFKGWKAEGSRVTSLDGYLDTRMEEDTVYHAVYQPKVYEVTIYDADGIDIGVQEVSYQESAGMPDYSSRVPEGYTFAGWAVTRADENDSACDYTCVDSDMEVQAVVRWANETLPVYVTVDEAVADGGYVVPVTLKNWPDAESSVYVCVALKTTDPVTGAQKTVYTDRERLRLDAGEEEVELLFELDYAGNAEIAEVLVLERKEDDTTGSAYSETVTAEIVAKSYWTEWSDWSTQTPVEEDGRIIETTTEYSYRTKETKNVVRTLLSGWTMNGWTLYDTTTELGDYGSWSDWSDSAVTATDTRQVQTRLGYHYYYYTCSNCGARMHGYGTCYSWAGGCGKSTIYSNSATIFRDSIPYTSAGDFHGTGVHYIDSGTNGRGYAYINPASGYYRAPITQYRYRTRQEKIIDHYYRWTDWSDWSAETAFESDTQEVMTRTLYRYCDEVKGEIPGTADTSGMIYTFDGFIGVDEDLQGKKATIMVYQSKNMDANQYQMQYIGQTEIGEDNSYRFSFIPKDEPSVGRGNYVVALGIEGTTGLLNIGVVEAPKRELNVKFYYVDETTGESIVLSEQTVTEGGDAQIPDAPEREGYVFLGWSTRTTNLIGDTSIEAIYAPRTYTVVFVDWANESVGFQTAEAGTPFDLPDAPEAEGKTFLGWDVLLEDENAVITGNMVVTAVYETETYIVRFLDEEGAPVSVQTVAYGDSAEPPADLTVNGMAFLGWSTEDTWWNVTDDMDVQPIIAYAETTAAPMANIPEYSSGLSTVLELTAEDGAVIYYTLDGTEPTEESDVYTEPIYLEDTAYVMAMAVSAEKNNSEITHITFYYDDSPVQAEPVERVVLATKEIQVMPGETVDLEVILEDNPGLVGYHFFVECDRSVFGANQNEYGEILVEAGEAYAEGTIMSNVFGAEGWQIMWFNTYAANSSGALFTLPLIVSEEAEAGVYTVTISYAPENTLTADYSEVVLDGESVSVEGSEDALYGDANGDGKRNLSDVILIARHVIGMESILSKNLDLADVNGDGKITTSDAIRLARFLIGAENTLR